MFLDSNVFIHFFRNDARCKEPCRRLLERISKGEQHASISPLVLDEVVYHLIDLRGKTFALEAWAAMRKIPNLKLLPIDEAVVGAVPEYIRQGLEPHDAFHAAVMRANGIGTICSYDKDFDIVKGIRRQEPK